MSSNDEGDRFQTIAGTIKKVLEELEKEKDIFTKVNVDKDAGVVRIYGEGSDVLKRATSALSEILELSYTTAEHHPYWGLLYHATEVSKMVLEAWNSNLTKAQISEIEWRVEEIKSTIERVQDFQGDSHDH